MTGLWVVAALAALAIVLELIARRWFRRRPAWYVWPRWYRRRLELDRTVHPQLEPICMFEVNRDGERGPSVPRDAAALYRVLVAGGSAVECALLDDAASWTGQLHLELQRPDHPNRLGARAVHVGNIGRSGMDARALEMILRNVLPRYEHLDAIVLMVGPGDMVRWIESGAVPDSLPPPVPPGDAFEENAEEVFAWWPRRMALKRVAKLAQLRWLKPVDVRPNAARWMGRARTERANAREMRDVVPDPTRMLDAFEKHLRVCLQLAQDKAPRVLLVHQPGFRKERYTPEEEALLWHGNVGSSYRGQSTGTFYSTKVLFRLLDLVQERAARVAKEVGVEQLAPEGQLEMSGRHFIDHFHFTPEGCTVLARAVAAALLTAPTSRSAAPSPPP